MEMTSMIRSASVGISRLLIRDEFQRKQVVVSCHNAKAAVSRLRGTATGFNMFAPTKESLRNVFPIDEFYRGNALYGIGGVLRKYAGYKSKLPVCVEHGLYFGDYVEKNVVDGALPGIVTFSEHRRRAISAVSGRDAMPVGPYLQYAEPFLSPDQFRQAKKKLGKTLLVFPAHSIEEANENRSDATLLSQAIEDLEDALHFDSVLVCFYYNDFLQGRKFAARQPVTTVCAGHRFDPQFLSRLKSLISLADYTVSDDVGTHVGYCVSMKKPHSIIVSDERKKTLEIAPEVGEIAKAFTKIGPLDESQRAVADEYWGLSLMRSPEYLHEYFESCNLKLGGHRR